MFWGGMSQKCSSEFFQRQGTPPFGAAQLQPFHGQRCSKFRLSQVKLTPALTALVFTGFTGDVCGPSVPPALLGIYPPLHHSAGWGQLKEAGGWIYTLPLLYPAPQSEARPLKMGIFKMGFTLVELLLSFFGLLALFPRQCRYKSLQIPIKCTELSLWSSPTKIKHPRIRIKSPLAFAAWRCKI